MAAGIQQCGDACVVHNEDDFTREGAGAFDAHVFYGLEGNLPKVFETCLADPLLRAVFIDLGYFGRREGGRFSGFHKVTVNARHPTAYYRHRISPPGGSRFSRFGITPKPWKTRGRYVVLCGMSPKAAWAEGYLPMEWERAAAASLRAYTDRPVIFRPKPSDAHATAIPGTYFSTKGRPLEADLADAFAVVSHHSNVNIEALIAGVPSFTWGGVAREMSLQDLTKIETPIYPIGRAQWLEDIAYTQWSVAEMAHGSAWKYLREEGLV